MIAARAGATYTSGSACLREAPCTKLVQAKETPSLGRFMLRNINLKKRVRLPGFIAKENSGPGV
jgi:hypothetical protein